jgi:hypothetical protein
MTQTGASVRTTRAFGSAAFMGLGIPAGGRTTDRPAARATAAALNLLVLTLIGAGLGPTLVGAPNDAFQGTFGAEAIRWSLVLVAATSLWSGAHARRGARTFRADLLETAREDRSRAGEAALEAPGRG